MIKNLMNNFISKFTGYYFTKTDSYRIRASTEFAKKYFKNKEIIGAEIGVFEGSNSKFLLRNLNFKKLYLIDPYGNYSDNQTVEKYDSCLQKRTLKAERKAKRRLKKYSNKIIWIKKPSSKAIKEIKEKLDYIYIDGNHRYPYVKEDIEKYYKILASKGILSGHDIGDKEVQRAFWEFVIKNKLTSNILREDWWIEKK